MAGAPSPRMLVIANIATYRATIFGDKLLAEFGQMPW
jgi:hypothetical protein